ncbi:MAG: hypothetical protein AB1706_10305 [Pseudomonadota bacterium]
MCRFCRCFQSPEESTKEPTPKELFEISFESGIPGLIASYKMDRETKRLAAKDRSKEESIRLDMVAEALFAMLHIGNMVDLFRDTVPTPTTDIEFLAALIEFCKRRANHVIERISDQPERYSYFTEEEKELLKTEVFRLCKQGKDHRQTPFH